MYLQKKLTKLQAYNLIIIFMDKLYSKGFSTHVSDFITYAYFLKDKKPLDPAAWPEWLQALKTMHNKDCTYIKTMSLLETLDAMVIFFSMYCSLYDIVPVHMQNIVKIIKDLQNNKRFAK